MLRSACPGNPASRCQGVLGVANCTIQRALDPAVHLLLRRCQSLRQARFDDGVDDGGELLPRFLRVALEYGLPGYGIMEAGLDILQKLPRRQPGLFDSPLHLSCREVGDLARHAAESGLFRRRIVQSPRHIFERAALHHAELVAEPFEIIRVHLRKLLDQIEENQFSRPSL